MDISIGAVLVISLMVLISVMIGYAMGKDSNKSNITNNFEEKS